MEAKVLASSRDLDSLQFNTVSNEQTFYIGKEAIAHFFNDRFGKSKD